MVTGKFIYVSATRGDGSFAVRGMAGESKALDVFAEFSGTRAGGRAVFTVLSSNDARLRVRPSAAGFFEAEVIGRAARKASLWGLLPAMPEIALRRVDFRSEEIEQIIHALYVLGPGAFCNLVEQEIGA